MVLGWGGGVNFAKANDPQGKERRSLIGVRGGTRRERWRMATSTGSPPVVRLLANSSRAYGEMTINAWISPLLTLSRTQANPLSGGPTVMSLLEKLVTNLW